MILAFLLITVCRDFYSYFYDSFYRDFNSLLIILHLHFIFHFVFVPLIYSVNIFILFLSF